MTRRLPLALAALACLLALPAPALAHGLHAAPGEGERSVLGYVSLGISHMNGGWDHLLFIAGIVVLAGTIKGAAKLISLFVAGHSLTLLVATLAGWQLNAAGVDVVIALSLVFIGWRVLRGRPARWAPTLAAIFAFGLVHGLGLSTRLQELDLPAGGALVARILAFNLGVEVGQLTALAVLVTVGYVVVDMLLADDLARGRRLAAGGLIATGLVAALGLSFLALQPDEPAPAAAAATAANANCTDGPCTPAAPPISVGEAHFHPDRAFYPPGKAPGNDELLQALAHNLIVVKYRADLPQAEQQALAQWAQEVPVGPVVVSGGTQMPFEVGAVTRERILTCPQANLKQLTAFRDRWLDGLLRRQ